MPKLWLAVFWMTGTLLSFLGMGLAGRELADLLSPPEIGLYRSVVCLLILLPILVHYRWPVRTQLGKLHVVRNIVHFLAQSGWFYGLSKLPMAQVISIEFTAPLWTALFASLFLGERLTLVRAGAILLGFAGILIILRPGMVSVAPASLVVLAAAVFFAITYTLTKFFVATESPLTIIFYMNLVHLPLGLVASVHDLTLPDMAHLPWVALLGVVGLTSHYCLSRALACADAGLVVPLDFLRLPLVAVVAWLMYEEALDPFVAIGAVVIVAGNWINLLGEQRRTVD